MNFLPVRLGVIVVLALVAMNLLTALPARAANETDCASIANANLPICTYISDFSSASRQRPYEGETASLAQKIQTNPTISASLKNKLVASINEENTSREAYCSGQTANLGARVQIIYLRKPNQPALNNARTRYLRDLVATVNYIFKDSAAKTRGDIKVRWVRNSDCSVSVKEIVTSQSATITTYEGVKAAMIAAGKTSNDRKFMAFVPVPHQNWSSTAGGVCGAATLHRGLFTDGPAQNNIHNTRVGYAALWYGNARSCWTPEYTAHELVHNLGGVQDTAPHTSGNGHCTDGRDVMCYPDGGPNAGNYTQTVCPAELFDYVLDCGNDDYFHSNPPAGSYLSQRWNVANSRFLTKRMLP